MQLVDHEHQLQIQLKISQVKFVSTLGLYVNMTASPVSTLHNLRKKDLTRAHWILPKA